MIKALARWILRDEIFKEQEAIIMRSNAIAKHLHEQIDALQSKLDSLNAVKVKTKRKYKNGPIQGKQ